MKRPTLIVLLFATTTTIIFSFAISAAISISDQQLVPSTNLTSSPSSTATTITLLATTKMQTAQNLPNNPQIAANDQATSSKTAPSTSRAAQSGRQLTSVNKQQQQRKQQAASRSKQRNYEESRAQHQSSGGQRSKSANNSGGSVSNVADPLALAQQQARLMMGYNNTPPLFVTGTRDFFVDVVRYPLGTKLTTMKAVDIDGDQLEYSLQPANLHDASSYFSIDSTSGELRLANKQFQFYSDHKSSIMTQAELNGSIELADDKNGSDNGDDNDDDDNGGTAAQGDSGDNGYLENSESSNDELMNKNLYFLNVAADDGRYTSIVELQIHVMNSSSLAGLQSLAGGLPVQLTPEGSKRASERMENIIRKKTKEFYDKLNKVPPQQMNNSTIVYPNFVNPSLIKPFEEVQEIPANAAPISLHQEEPNFASPPSILVNNKLSSLRSSSPSTPKTITEAHVATSIQQQPFISQLQDQQHQLNQSLVIGSLVSRGLPAAAEPSAQPFKTLVPQPILVGLVVFCSCITIALVSLAFLIPSTIRKLRKELKHVERQHEQLSQQTSISSSTVCSSSSSMVTHNHNSSLSQFTLNSDRSCTTRGGPGSSVCRQSSLDSTLTVMSPQRSMICANQQPFNRVNNGSIANPVYLDQLQNHHQPQLAMECLTGGDQNVLHNQHQQHHPFSIPSNINHLQFTIQQQQQQQTANGNFNNVYYPLDDNDEFYSTINTEGTALGSCLTGGRQIIDKPSAKLDTNIHNYFMANCVPPQSEVGEPDYDAATALATTINPDSALSLQANRNPLSRFLSLPLRHQSNAFADEQLIDFNDNGSVQSSKIGTRTHQHQQNQKVASKTIARSSNIQREQPNNSNRKWELERHKLKFLELLGEGQFGLVFRCNLSQENDREQVAAVKTLKVSVSRDVRGREEFLAEIEIMKLICNHPNVVRILHCCTHDAQLSDETKAFGDKPILLVMEYVELGKLQSLLERSRLNHDYTTSDYSNANCSGSTNDRLTSRDLLKFIYHVAKGMEYVASQCIVHRDLASRNILVNSQRICKIGDFGMARHMQSLTGVYERHSLNAKIPVRWMAPEVLLNNKFTTKSDVFSFGILMWEIVTLGSTPYTHLKTEQVIDRVAKGGERPIKPEYCHAQLYKIMSECWSCEPDERPTFRGLVKQFDALLLSLNDYIELDQYPNHNYYNIPKSSAPYELL